MTDKEFKLIENLIVELKKHNVDKDSCGYITIRLSQLNKCAEMLTWLKKNSDANQEEIFEYFDLLEDEYI